ncbi:MAG: MATE family efflux transporter [bacterium]|nr:MATE family efflux transporter [bacterium]
MNQISDEQLGKEPIGKLMLQMAIPSIVAQTVNILYSIIDRIYIGHIRGIGTNALTGVGLTLPIITLVSAFSAFVGAGGAPLAAIFMGKGDKKRAEQILGCGIFMLGAFSAVLMVFFYLFKVPLLYLFGASDQTIGYADRYLSFYLIGTLMVQLSLGLNPFIISQGQARVGMLTILIGAAVNIVLDPIFIFVLHMDVQGAAVATVISQTVSAVWICWFLAGKRSAIRIRRELIRPDWKNGRIIFSLGISPFIMRSTESLISVVMNRGLRDYGGDLYVGSLTIMQSLMQFISAPIAGFTQGVQPIISYNFGAGSFERVKKTYRAMISIVVAYGFVSTAVVMLFPRVFAGFFAEDAELIALTGRVIPVFMCGMLIFGLQQGIQPTFLATGQAKISLFLAMLRKVILLVPLAVILPHWFGVWGVYIAEPVSDILSAVTAGILFFINIKKILSKESVDRIQ